MLIGIYGTHCTGKTTYLESLDIPGIRKVFGDMLTPNYDNIPEFPALYDVYRTLPGKQELIRYMVCDRETLWIAEGMRFWGSIFHHIKHVPLEMGGGLFMIIITTTAEYMEQALRKRAVLSHRIYAEKYWTPHKLEYESSTRLIRAAAMHLDPKDWIELPFDDFGWRSQADLIIHMFVEDISLWYPTACT